MKVLRTIFHFFIGIVVGIFMMFLLFGFINAIDTSSKIGLIFSWILAFVWFFSPLMIFFWSTKSTKKNDRYYTGLGFILFIILATFIFSFWVTNGLVFLFLYPVVVTLMYGFAFIFVFEVEK